jgi:hypothetical protein
MAMTIVIAAVQHVKTPFSVVACQILCWQASIKSPILT